MWGNKKEASVSNFFEGINFLKKCFTDFFDKFTNAINKTNLEVGNLSVPKVIVIGSESSGKSSLLENIVKCQLFPKNTTFCTKIPIHLIMKNTNNENEIKYKLFYNNLEIIATKENIYNEIDKIMSGIIDDVSDEQIITIEITEKNIVDFEFYDLPGIRAYLPELATKTTNLAKKYLSMDDVIPICVIPSTTPRITSYIPMALIKEYKKEKETFICLTMCDRLQDENIEDLLINRIILQTDEYDSNTFGGVCGIINRNHKNNVKLSDNDNEEKQWFHKNIYSIMPDNYIYKNKLLENLGINNLINKLSSSYKKYINDKWIPKIIKKIKNKNIKLEKDIYDIGFDPKNEKDLNHFIQLLLLWFKRILILYIKNIYSNTMKSHRCENLNLFMNTLSINNLKIEHHDIFEYLQLINVDFVERENLIVNIERFEKLIINICNFIDQQLKLFNVDFMNKYNKFIEYDYYSNDIKLLCRKVNNISEKYISEFVIHINNLLNTELYNYINALTNLEENTFELRNEFNNKILKNNEAIEDLQSITNK